jgi:hypothetical protein
MPQKGGRPKGSVRCHPGTVEIKLYPNVRGASGHGLDPWRGPYESVGDWRQAAAARVAAALTVLESARGPKGIISAQYELGFEDLVDADVRLAVLLGSGMRPDRLRAALMQLGAKFATANFDADGVLTLRASSARGSRNEASSAELVHALSCLPGLDSLISPREADLYLAVAPTAKSYAALVASIPLLRDELTRVVSQPAHEFEDRQQSLVEQFYAGDLSLEALLAQDEQNCKEAGAALDEAVKAARLQLAGLPAASTLYSDLMCLVEDRHKLSAVDLLPLTAGFFPEDEESSAEDYARPYFAQDAPAWMLREQLEVLRERRKGTLSYERKMVLEGLPQTPSGIQARWSEMLPLVDGYVAGLQRPGLTGNEASSRKIAAGMLDGVLAQHDMASRMVNKRAMRDWDGTTSILPPVTPGTEHRLNTAYRHKFVQDDLPWIHDFAGPYEGVSPTPVIIALAPYLDDVGAAQLAGVMSVRDGWQEQSVKDMMGYGSTRADAEQHVRRAAERLRLL